MASRPPSRTLLSRALFLALLAFSCLSRAAQVVDKPFQGITLITRSEAQPHELNMHVVIVDLSVPGLRFKLTPPAGTLETLRQTTLEFLNQEHAQIAVNAHFFLPFPSAQPDAALVGFAASEGVVYSGFETPSQSYAIVANAPALNIDRANRASIVHRDPAFADGKHVLEDVPVWTALAGAAQIVTNGAKTVPQYLDATHPSGQLTPGGPGAYTNAKSWYDALNARTAIGLTRDARNLILFTVDARGGSDGMQVGELADLLIEDYGVFNALLLDGGGSTTLAMEDPNTHAGKLCNVSSDNPNGRSVGSNLAIFAAPIPLP